MLEEKALCDRLQIMKAVFVTGTDTGVGKTTVSGLLGRFLLSRGYRTVTQKWIQTGADKSGTDIDVHLRLMKRKRQDLDPFQSLVSPFIFNFASSPHLAAFIEKKTINIEKIKQDFKSLSENFDFVIVEGIGGVLVPLNTKKLVIDIANDLGLPTLIVADNKLGAINHTLLTIEALKRRKIKIIGIIFNNLSGNTDKIIMDDNPKIIKILTGEKILGILPRSDDSELLYKKFIPIGKDIEDYYL